MRRKYTVNDPALVEYVFNAMKCASSERLKELSFTELGHFKNEITMYQFAGNASLDARLLLLSRLGISFVVQVAEDVEMVDAVLKRVPKQYDNKEVVSLTKTMKDGKIFMMSSRDVLLASHMAAQNSHMNLFVLNYEFSRIREKMNTRHIQSMDMGVREARESVAEIAGMLLLALMDESQVRIVCGIGQYQLRILLALFYYPEKFVGKNTLARLLYESPRTRSIAKVAYPMVQEGYIARETGVNAESNFNDKVSYTIMERGIDTVMKYINYVIAQMRKNLL